MYLTPGDIIGHRLELARRHGIAVLDERTVDDVPAAILETTGGRGVDGVVDAVGMEVHGTPFRAFALAAAGKLPGPLARKAAETMSVDRMGAMRTAFASVRRAGTISLIGVYGGQADPVPMMDLFDKGVTMRMGQAHVKRWVDDIMPRAHRRRRPAGHPGPRHPCAPARAGPARLPDLPEEAGRLHQGRPQTLTAPPDRPR